MGPIAIAMLTLCRQFPSSRWVVDLFGGLTDKQQSQLHTLLGSLKTGIHQNTKETS